MHHSSALKPLDGRSAVITGASRGLGRATGIALVDGAGRTVYCATKAGLLGLTSPGQFSTEMNVPLMQNAELNQFILSRVPLGRWGKVEEIGRLAVFLCSEPASFYYGGRPPD